MKALVAILFLVISFSLNLGTAQEINTAKLDSFFDILANENQAMGSIAIAQNGAILYQRAIGNRYYANNKGIAATDQTKYRIGSISKMFTATMIFQLIEEGKMKLATTLDEFFPNIPNAETMTIGNLLNHRSGIHNFTDEPDYMIWMGTTKTRQEMIEIIANGGSDFQPDSKGAYSNANYVVLGYIIEMTTQKPLNINLQLRIASKLGMKKTYVGGKTDTNENEAYSFQYSGSWKQFSETDMSIPGGAGAVVSTPVDMTRFIEGLFSGKLISNRSLEQMKTIVDGYGMGMFQIPFYEKSGYGHNGSIDAFTASLGFFPEDNMAIAYCTNGQLYPMNEIIVGVLSIIYDRDYALPSFETIALTQEQLDRYLGVYGKSDFPLKLTITRNDSTLYAQATGQMAIPLDATAIDKFKFDPAGIQIEFNRDENELILKQGGGVLIFTKE